MTPAPVPDRNRRLNAICPYFTMFPLDFPLTALGNSRPNQWVLDPFCGRGTTLFASRLLGLRSVGIDTNPVAVALAEAKLVSVDAASVVKLAKRLIEARRMPQSPPQGPFWEWAFHHETLTEICLLRRGLLDHDDPDAVALRAIVLGILHGPQRVGLPTYLSNQMPRTYATKPSSAVRFWREHSMAPEYVDVVAAVERRVEYVFSDPPQPAHGEVHSGDARRVLARLRRKFDWVITSPPYPGMRSYLPDQWLRAWFLGGKADVDYATHDGQIITADLDKFIMDLAGVWRAVAARCVPGARLVVRMGSMPSVKADPHQIMERSLEKSARRWQLDAVQSSGVPAHNARQAHQFSNAGPYMEELDFFVRLDEDGERRK